MSPSNSDINLTNQATDTQQQQNSNSNTISTTVKQQTADNILNYENSVTEKENTLINSFRNLIVVDNKTASTKMNDFVDELSNNTQNLLHNGKTTSVDDNHEAINQHHQSQLIDFAATTPLAPMTDAIEKREDNNKV